MAQRRLLIKSHPRREAPRTTFADPTRTGGLRRQFVAELRRQFSQLKADLLRYQQSEMVANVFCPTGEGGGVDPTCSPGGSAVHFGDLSKDVQTRISVAPWDSLNPELRDPTLIRGQEFHQDRVRKTDELFKHAVELRRPEKFIRGVSGTVYPMKAGETFTEPGYLRLSNDQSTAEGFTERPGKTGQVLHLTVPKGSRVLPGDHVREHEIYLPRGASFRVTRVESKENDLNIQGVMQHIHHIHAELVTSKGVNNSLALDSFSAWLEERARQVLLSFSQERLWSLLVDSAFRRGASRSFDDVVPRSVSRDKMEFDRGSREGFLTALMSQGMPTDQVMTTNEGGVEIDCGANAPGGGGFQPGNTCARGEKSGKPGREQIIKDAADRIEVTDEIVKEDPIDDDDLDAIEERMTEEEINQMQEVMDAWKESYADSYEEDHNYDFDEDDVARGADWDDGEVHSRAMSAVDGLDIDDESKALAKTEIEAWYQDTRLHGEDAARELEKHLRNSGVHDEVLSEVRSIRDTAAEEIQAHRDTLVERERADRRERFIDQYDDSGDRREYLRDFYDRHSHEYRFSGGFKKEGSWGKDVDGDLTYGFTTSQGNKYEVWSFDKFKEGDVHVREFGFKDAEGSHGVTGAGGAHEVFKTVSSAMTAVISKKDLPAVYFSASEESRQRLYDRLVKTVAKVLPEYAAVAVPATDKTPKGYIVAKRSLIPTLREHAEKRGIGSKFEVLVNASRWIELEPDFQSEWIGLTDYVSNALLSRLRTAFDTVKALAKRAWDEFKGGVRGMVQGVQRAATDGVLQGKSPQKVAREAVKVVDRAFEQAKGLVQTEVTRAHAKGQLVGFVALGVKEVGVLVEWRVKRDANGQIASTVCPSCRAMEGVVLKISEADGLIPLHPRCMCAYSKPRENVKGQKRSKGDIDKAIAKARARRKAKPGQGWGAKVRIAQKRPTGNRDLIAEFSERIENVFCPTGPGGGVDPTCSPNGHRILRAETETSVLPPEEKSKDEAVIRESYIKDAKDMADSSYTQELVDRVKSRMAMHDERWSETHAQVMKLADKEGSLREKHLKEMSKLDKMTEANLKAKKADKDWPHSEEDINKQAEKCDEALTKYFKHRNAMADKSWDVIRKSVSNEQRRFDGHYSIQEVKIHIDPNINDHIPSTQVVAEVEKVNARLSKCISQEYERRINHLTTVKAIPAGQTQRAHFSGSVHKGPGDHGEIFIGPFDKAGVIAHELGHSLEMDLNTHLAARGFLYHRVGKEVAVPTGSEHWEVGRTDQFGKAFESSASYVGKHYKTPDTEIVSMGLQKMYEEPHFFAKHDPEYFKFMLGVLDGSFR